jgi:hypothetical protein
MKYFLGIIILIFCLWVYHIQYCKISTHEKFFVDDISNWQTGDLILFKAYNNFYSILHGSYFGHVGMIYVGDNGVPYIFEANGIEHMSLKPHHSKTGIFVSPAIDRIKKYKGVCYYKRLNMPISPFMRSNLEEFIQYALKHLQYDYNVVQNGIKKLLGLKRCNHQTDCGQMLFLALIKMDLIDISEYDVPRLNHLLYVCNLDKLKGGYKYLPLVEIIDHPFSY